MTQLVPTDGDRASGRCLHPNRVSIWPVEIGGYGIGTCSIASPGS